MSRRNELKPGRLRSQTEIRNEVERIGKLDAQALRMLWPDWFGKPPPARMRRETLALAMAYQIQSATLGGLSTTSIRKLNTVAATEFGEVSPRPTATARLRPGTKFVREWQGVIHEVAVIEDGFVWCGVRHRSLSAIARAITGSRWNGLVFFGLKPEGSSRLKSDSAPATTIETIDG